MKIMHNELSKIKKKQKDRLLHKVETLIETQNVSLSPVDHDDMREIILKEESTLLQRKNLTMFQRLFWQKLLRNTIPEA